MRTSWNETRTCEWADDVRCPNAGSSATVEVRAQAMGIVGHTHGHEISVLSRVMLDVLAPVAV